MWRKNDNCSWVIQGARPSDRVTLQINHMDLDQLQAPVNNCSATEGHLTVRDGPDADAPLIGRYCGHQVPPMITSQGSALYVHVQNSISAYGQSFATKQRFRATYSVEDSCKGRAGLEVAGDGVQ